MEKMHKNLLDGSLEQFNDSVVPKIPVFAGNDMTSEVYYFRPNQVLKEHKHPNGEQIFVFLKGSGIMTVGEKEHHVKEGAMILVSANEWHSITNGSDNDMVAVQITKVGAGSEFKDA